jgi:hypothetical protein
VAPYVTFLVERLSSASSLATQSRDSDLVLQAPVEITLNSILSAAITYTWLGISIQAAVVYTGITAVAEFFDHWNVRTPHWFGPIFQRPESHRVHHKRSYHTNNYADLPVFDVMFGTYENPLTPVVNCGFTEDREDGRVRNHARTVTLSEGSTQRCAPDPTALRRRSGVALVIGVVRCMQMIGYVSGNRLCVGLGLRQLRVRCRKCSAMSMAWKCSLANSRSATDSRTERSSKRRSPQSYTAGWPVPTTGGTSTVPLSHTRPDSHANCGNRYSATGFVLRAR